MSCIINDLRQFTSIFSLECHLTIRYQNKIIKHKNKIAMTLVKVNNQLGKSFDGFVNEIFNDFPATFGKALREDVLGFPPVNIVEKTDAYNLEVAAPGFNKSDFNLKLEGKLLTISGEKKEETKDETTKSVRKEFTYKSFKRSFNVDEKIDGSNISAKYENGILLVTLPKKEEVKETSKEINIQ